MWQIVLLFLVTCWSLAHRDLNQLTKVGSAFLLLIAIAVVPETVIEAIGANEYQQRSSSGTPHGQMNGLGLK